MGSQPCLDHSAKTSTTTHYIIWDFEAQTNRGIFNNCDQALACCDEDSEIFPVADYPAYYWDCDSIVPFTPELEKQLLSMGNRIIPTFHHVTRQAIAFDVYDCNGQDYGGLEGIIFFPLRK